MPKTSERSYIARFALKKMSFRCKVYFASQFKRFYNLNIEKKVGKRKYCLELYRLIHQVKAQASSLKHKNNS